MASFLCSKKSLSGLMLLCFHLVTISNAVNIDMTLVTNHPLLDPFNTDDQYISIYLGQEHATLRDSITFDRIIKTAESTGRPSYDMSNETHGKRFHFRQSQGITALGAFRIGVEYEGESHYTSTIVLMHNAIITPEQTTLTAHLGETVTIHFNTDMMTDTLKWRFNGDSISGSKGKQSLTLENIQMDKAGLYKCFIQPHRWDADQQAIQLLHIIRCPAYRWGADCEQDCPECLNGGRCDVDSGECVCPPGFSGTTCDQVLGSNRFGQNGSFSCDTSGDDHSLACRGKLFCLPDPFGCTCAAGFMGIDCTRECAPGRYGANCLQECHCGPTNICKKDTGECMNGTTCADGWTGVNCQVRGSPSLDTGDDEVITDIATTSLYAHIADTTLAPIPVTTIDTIPASTTETTQPVPSFEISSFQYSRVNHRNPTTLVCVVKASPSPPALESISVTYTVNGQLTIIPRLNSTANETTRTSWYQATVRLDEMPKNFTCLFRGPDEMILASQDLAVYVFEPPSFNEANILVQESTSQSITIVWSAWNENRDYGNGPVIGYHVYYNIHGQNDLDRNITSDVTYTITGLTHDTQYDIRVTALREGEGGEGSYSSPITGNTSCIAPSAAPVLSLRGQTQSSISLSWEMIHEETWGCGSLSGILISVITNGQNDSPQTLPVNAEDGTATINDLQDCTTYRIKAAFQNKDELGIYSDVLSVSTSKIRPASVETLQTSPATTHIDVGWVVSSSICAPDYFILRYSLYRKLACPSPETTLVQIEVNTTSTPYRLDGLEPYSRYKISVIAVNSIGESEPTTRSVDTGAGPPAAIRNVTVNPERTSSTRLVFTWEPLNCRNVNGDFWYYYPRIFKFGNKKRIDHYYFDNDITVSSVKFENLESCTTYQLIIYARNIGVRDEGDFSVTTGLTGVTFISASTFGYQNMIRVSWSVPSGCEVDYYRLSYQLISRRACPDVLVIDYEVNKLNVTSPLTSVFKNILNLENYATYNITIIAVIDGMESLPRSVQGNTDDGKPSAIESVSYTSTAHSLTFEWEEPSCENLHGNLNGYEIDFVYSGRTARQTLSREENSLTFTDLIGCTEYTFTIRLVTATDYSEWYAIMAPTNISAPGEPNIREITKHQEVVGATGLTVTWNPPSTPPCEPTHYQIQYYIYQGDMCEDIPSQPQLGLTSAGSVNGSTFTFNILELRPNSEYMMFVRGKTSSGYGNSDSRKAVTGHSYPSGPPTKVRSTSTRKRSITFTWDKPACGYRNGPITSYDLILFDSAGGVVHQRNVSDSTTPETEIDGLIPYSNYSITVRAWNYELPGVYSPEFWAQTDEAKPGPPIRVNLPASDQESITVEWMSPNPPLGRIIGYYVLYWEKDDSSVTPIVRNVSFPCGDGQSSDINQRFSLIIPDLRPDTNYSVQVEAETRLGVGDPSPDQPLIRLTSEGIPSAPLDVAISSSSKSLMITWNQPKYPRGKIISYTMAYKVKAKPYDSSFQTGDSFMIKTLDGVSTSFLLEDLEPATLYEVYVVASTSKGMGDSSPHVDEFTEPPTVDELPKPSIPVIVMSVDGLPTIPFSDALDSPYITDVLVAVEERLPDARRRRQLTGYGTFAENPTSYIAAKVGKDRLPLDIIVGDNQTYGGYHNAPLKDKATYDIRTGVESNVGGQKSTLFGDAITYQTGSTGGGSVVPVVIGVIVALLLAAVVVVGVLYYRKKKGKLDRLPASILRPRRTPPVRPNNRNQTNDNVPMRQVHSLNRSGTLPNGSSTDGLCNAEINGDDGAIYANMQPEENAHNPISLDQLITYVAQKKSSAKNGFKQDYDSIPVGQLHPWDVAKKIENKTKNRYINIIAYDHSRVLLPMLDNDPHSDYINASFIDGYNYPRKYIAAQGPNIASVKDFWRMIWEEDCGKIVMLTNLVEGEKKKCEKYWPDKKMLYGKITVTMNSTEVNTHYTVRTFTVMFDNTIREVVQYHYTSWPDMGVPKYTTPLMNFIRTVKQHHTNSMGPIIVHCSAGVGRTGTFITLDAMLDQAEAENSIDVYNFITGLRNSRIKMVQVAEQYQFIFDALLETFVCGDTSIAQDLYLQRYPSLLAPSPDTGSTLLQEQFERLDMFTIRPRDDELRAARNPMNFHKNRYRDKLPTDKSRPYLITEVDGGTNYINASFLPGYTKKDMFIGTQTPLQDTVVDFWRLIFDYRISTIVMLNGMASEDQSMAEYWAYSSQSDVTHGPFTITLLNEEHYDEISCRTMEVRSTTSKSRVHTVYQLHLTTWPMASEVCTSAISFMELHRRAMVWNESNAKDAPILVHCKDGEGATGTFCALSSVLERLNVEKLVDVFQACKRLRAIRTGAVASLDQYEFIHSVMRLYLDSYDIYENYRT